MHPSENEPGKKNDPGSKNDPGQNGPDPIHYI